MATMVRFANRDGQREMGDAEESPRDGGLESGMHADVADRDGGLCGGLESGTHGGVADQGDGLRGGLESGIHGGVADRGGGLRGLRNPPVAGNRRRDDDGGRRSRFSGTTLCLRGVVVFRLHLHAGSCTFSKTSFVTPTDLLIY